ncbi:hypothetical protein PC116_g6988 [Phytophthora cactorum]|uniref:Uncharacterized protein n=1 Tax=Phytophthora cactorum TaxID=29920 RepID=A0A8T1LCE7_9STRA|nr:hypothetical protein PC114_g7925 [Phytophthora cactorum]KAG2946177.1 hypothetical protein PC117_g7836 [Phytophthora cactorum]KAG3001965.1 hypothetical protein PC120_g19972 [Phytophthora cactorum]KAG3019300.1 hypothetical protein PC119_g10355 [Phytophthora cactorum]KAG3187791.1 hypothetical protein PC128_g12466 [Phytophthora cactorum]
MKPNGKGNGTKGATVDRSNTNTRLDGRPRRTATLGQTYEEEEEPELDPVQKEWTLPSHRDLTILWRGRKSR